MINNLAAISEILGLEDHENDHLEESNKLEDYAFDSLAIVILQSFLDEECNIQIDPDDLPEFEYISDLDKFIDGHKQNAKN